MSGDTETVDQLILRHRPLARRVSKRLVERFGMDPEDAEQVAILGLIRAARRFDPGCGHSFTRYARYWMHHACRRRGPNAASMIRVPQDVFWPNVRFRAFLARVLRLEGPERVREEILLACNSDPGFAERWRQFHRAMHVKSLSDLREIPFFDGHRLVARDDDPLQAIQRMDQAEAVRAAVAKLRSHEAKFIALSFGLHGPPQSYAEIGRAVGLTRERVRQVVNLGLERLGRLIRRELPSMVPVERKR